MNPAQHLSARTEHNAPVAQQSSKEIVATRIEIVLAIEVADRLESIRQLSGCGAYHQHFGAHRTMPETGGWDVQKFATPRCWQCSWSSTESGCGHFWRPLALTRWKPSASSRRMTSS